MSDWRATSANEYPTVPSPAERLTGRALGIDIGGTSVKAAVVDVASGQLVTERIRELTPSPATPEAMLDVVVDVVRRLEATGKLTAGMPGGAGFPSVIRAGQAMTATQLDRSWIGAPVQEMLGQRLRRLCFWSLDDPLWNWAAGAASHQTLSFLQKAIER